MGRIEGICHREVRRYSQSFIHHVVEEVESGQLTASAAGRRYGIGGAATVSSWLRKYGKQHLLAKVVRVEHPEERDRLKALEARNRELESALADSQVKLLALESLLEVAEEHYGTDFKKNFGRQRSAEGGSGQGRKGRA